MKFKHLLRAALMIFSLQHLAFSLLAQTVVQFNVTNFTGSTNDTTINIKPQNNPVIYNGQFYWLPANGTNLATTNGFAQVSLIPGQYTVSLATVPQSWTINVTNSATALNAASLTTSVLIYNGINSLSGAAVTNDSHGNYFVTASTNTVSAAQVTNIVTALAVTNGQGGVTLAGTFSGNGAGMTGIQASNVVGLASGSISNGIYYAEQYGLSTNNTDVQNLGIFQFLLNECYTNGGGTVSLMSAGTFPMFPALKIWPNTTIRLGAATTLQVPNYQGLVIGVTNGGEVGIVNAYVTQATNVLNLFGVLTNGTAIPANYFATNFAYWTNGAMLVVESQTNGSGIVSNTNLDGTIEAGMSNWCCGIYLITNLVGNQLYLNRNVSVGAASNLLGAVGMALFRDAEYDNCPTNEWGVPQSTYNSFCSTNIQITGGNLNALSGYGVYGWWWRQCNHLVLRDINVFNFEAPYSTMNEDVYLSTFSDLGFYTPRDGLHMDGPATQCLVENLHGHCSDNELAIGCSYTGRYSSYPLDGLPYVGFQNSGAYNSRYINTSSAGGYNPIRACGTPQTAFIGCLIDGLYGWTGIGQGGVGLVNDPPLYGMVVSGDEIKNINIAIPTNGVANDSVQEVYAVAGIQDLTIDNITVNNAVCGVYVSATGLVSLNIHNVYFSGTNTTHGDNNLVYASFAYGKGDGTAAPEISISGIRDYSTTTPAGDAGYPYTIYLNATSGGNPTVNIHDVQAEGHQGLIYIDGNTGNVHYNLSDISCYTAPFINFESTAGGGGFTYFSFADVFDPNGNSIISTNAGTTIPCFSGNIDYGNGTNSVGNSAQIQFHAHVNGNIAMYPQNDTGPLLGDVLLDANKNNLPYVYTGSSQSGADYGFVPLNTPATALTQTIYIQTNSTGPHGIIQTNYLGQLIGVGTY